MKKFLLSILTMIYLVVSSGVAMEVHYCMGKRAGADLYNTANDKCSRCGMKEKKDGCCRDEHKFYKLADAHKNVFNNYNASVSPVVITETHDLFTGDITFPVTINSFYKKALPADAGPPIFLKNCVFRI